MAAGHWHGPGGGVIIVTVRLKGAAGKGVADLKEFLQLFLLFVKVGAFTFGGGYAMLPMFERELVTNRGWLTKEEILNYYAVAQCVPGVIAVNTATLVGYRRRGVAGGIVATLGMITPSLIIILAIATFLQNIAEVPMVAHAFAGIRVGVTVLIINAIIRMWKSGITDWVGLVLCLVTVALSVVFDVSPVFPVVGAALVGLVITSVRKAGKAA